MNIYDDYINYLDECMELLDLLRENNSPLLIVVNDVIKVTDYIYQQYDKKQPISEELEEIFTLGFGYLSNVLTELKSYYEDCFDKDIQKLNKYAPLIIDIIMLEDFKSFLDVNDYINDETKKEIDDMMAKLDRIVANGKQITLELQEDVDLYINDHTPAGETFTPVYTVYAMIAEEISMTNDIML